MSAPHAEKLAGGKLAKLGLVNAAWQSAANEVLARAEAEGLETIRVLFADPHGILRGKTIVAEALASVFANGMNAPSTLLLKDTSARTVFPVWSGETDHASPVKGAGDILMVPDPATFRVLPWSPHSAWLLCDVAYSDGSPIPFAPRTILKNAVAQLAQKGFALTVGLEVEFHVFGVTDGALDHASGTVPPRAPETRNLAPGYQFLSDTHYDRLEPVMDLLRRNATALGLPVRSTEVEMGPSQFEFTFAPDGPMEQADALTMFRAMVKEVCAREGLHATFMCRPVVANAAASGWHIHQSLSDATGANLFEPGHDRHVSPHAAHWIAGLLAHARESCLLTTPTVNGYKRYQPFQLAPERIAWGYDNRGAMIRALMQSGDPASRIENRAPEPGANPYFVLSSQIISGLDGMTRNLTPPAPTEAPYGDDAQQLPRNLGDAIVAFEASELYRSTLGEETVAYLARLKRAEWERYLSALSAWEQSEYFGLL